MTPLKTSLSRSVGKLLGVQKDTDLSLRGATQSSRVPPPTGVTVKFAMFGGGGAGGAWVGGGGAGGGYVEEDAPLILDVSYAVTIGGGGAAPAPGPPAADGLGNPGGNTTFVTADGTFTAYGGGGGGGNGQASAPVGPGRPGGSGGGMGAGSYSPATVGLGNKVTGSTNPAQASPPQPQTLSRVQGYDGGTKSGTTGGGGGGAGGAGTDGPNSGGGSAITLTNFGPFNGTYGAGGGGCSSGSGGSPNAGDGVSTNETAKNASGYANGGGGVREAGYVGGTGSAGIFVLRVPTSYTISSPGGSTSTANGYNYLQRTSNGNVTVSEA